MYSIAHLEVYSQTYINEELKSYRENCRVLLINRLESDSRFQSWVLIVKKVTQTPLFTFGPQIGPLRSTKSPKTDDFRIIKITPESKRLD